MAVAKIFHFFGKAELVRWEGAAQGPSTGYADFHSSANNSVVVKSPEIDVESDVFYEVTLDALIPEANAHWRIFVLDAHLKIALVCKTVKSNGREFRASLTFRSLHRSKRVYLQIENLSSHKSKVFSLGSVSLVRVGKTKEVASDERRYKRDVGAVVSMATVVGREDMLLDAVSTLYRQADKIRIYLNGHDNISQFLDDPKIELAWSRDYGDFGDAGKFFWAGEKETSIQFITDDDFIFPVDYVDVMARKLLDYDSRAVVGAHGVILRQPMVGGYYDKDSRFTYRYAIGLGRDFTCHNLGTGAICYDKSVLNIDRNTFCYPNMADIWLMKECQKQDIPMISVSRSHNWLIDNKSSCEASSIYVASSGGAESGFNTAMIQTSVCRQLYPVRVRTRRKNGVRIGDAKLIVECDGSPKGAMEALGAWNRSRAPDMDWTLVLVCNAPAVELDMRRFVDKENLSIECFFVKRSEAPWLLSVLRRDDESLFIWLSASYLPLFDIVRPLRSALPGGVSLGCVSDQEGRNVAVVWSGAAWSDPNLNCGSKAAGVDAQATVLSTKLKLKSDEYFVRLAGGAVGHAFSFHDVFEGASRGERKASTLQGSGSINDTFERVLVLNLDRRPDRLAAFSRQAKKYNLEFERVAAVDGSVGGSWDEWSEYFRQPILSFPKGTGPFKWEWDLYNKYLSENHRVAHFEKKLGRKMLSKGAWGYSKSMIKVLRQALIENWESFLLFDDDCLFHKDLERLFPQMMAAAPEDWLVLGFGAIQYSWDAKWIAPCNDFWYHDRGTSVGSHAVAVRRDVYPDLLASLNRMQMPYDVGALHEVRRRYPTRCLISQPNLFIQDVSESDIGDSEHQSSEGQLEANRFRWKLDDYERGVAIDQAPLVQQEALREAWIVVKSPHSEWEGLVVGMVAGVLAEGGRSWRLIEADQLSSARGLMGGLSHGNALLADIVLVCEHLTEHWRNFMKSDAPIALLLHPRFCYPQTLDVGGLPSLEQSIRKTFLASKKRSETGQA